MRNVFDKISLFVIPMIAILNVGTVYLANNYNTISLISLSIVVLISLLSLSSTFVIKRKFFIAAILYLLFLIPFAIISKAGSGVLLFCGFVPCFSIIIYYYYKRGIIKSFLLSYVNIVLIIGVVSTILWLLISCFHIIETTGVCVLKWGGTDSIVSTFHNIYFECQNNSLKLFGINLGVRNCGIFSEAPMASFVYSSALILNCYLSNNRRNIYELLLTIIVITTISTTGIIVVIGYYASIVCFAKCKGNVAKILKSIIMFFVFVLAAMGVMYLVIDKLKSGSGSVRREKIGTEFTAFCHSPIVGNGFNVYTNGSSNSFTSVLADGGLLLFGFYYIPLIVEILRNRKKNMRFVLIVLYCFMLLITSVAYSYFNTIVTIILWYDVLQVNNKNSSFRLITLRIKSNRRIKWKI